MEWIRAHPYGAALAAAAALILIGAFVVSQRSPVRPESSSPRAWGGIGANLLDPSSSVPGIAPQQSQNLYTAVQSGPPFHYTPTPTSIPNMDDTSGNDFDFDAFLTILSQSGKSAGASSTGGTFSLENAYSFIPGGLISTSTPTKERTPKQQALFIYGNEAGASIESYERLFPNAPQILKDQFEDRQDPAKNGSLRALAGSLTEVGRSLETLSDIPAEVAAANANLAKSYRELGDKLARVADVSSDQEVLDAILAYNVAVETFTRNYVALATLFSVHGVTFSNDDPGRIFTFTNTNW
jgi:hypothetical protein